MSVINLIDSFGGKICVPLAMYSLVYHFELYRVSDSWQHHFPQPQLHTLQSTIAGALIVIEVETLSRGIPDIRILMSSTQILRLQLFLLLPHHFIISIKPS